MVRRTVAVVMLALCASLPCAASAHVERSGYWPDPAPDCSISPCAGGAVPKAKSLSTSIGRKRRKHVRVVCQPDSMSRLRGSIATARKNGYDMRPTDHHSFSKAEARKLLKINKSLLPRCRFHEIQPAIPASGNNDRVVIMPGLYTEPTARAQPTHDPACLPKYAVHSDSGDPGALSHTYQVHC